MPTKLLDSKDIEFLLNTKLIGALPEKAIEPLLACMNPMVFEKGERFITQHKEGDSLFIIQQGLCSIIVETDGKQESIAQRREGDVVGEMALLTGETRTAHVDAASSMKVWELTRNDFDTISALHPDLREFLTELLTNRLENSAVIAVRNVGRYTMTNLLGQGGWSFVYRGKHQALNMPVAIKMLKHNLAMDDDFLERFRQEARLIAGMKHRNIIQVFDIEELYRTIFIVMEVLEGESLKGLLERRGALPFERATGFLAQICAGLEYAHHKGIVHQDIKPGNIMVLPGDHIKILDFGLACPAGEEDFDLTGTPGYMAPEQIEGDRIDARTDIYALGITAYEMFTGSKPYQATEVGELFQQHLKNEVPDPALLVPDLPQVVREFMLRSIRKDPNERYQNISEVIRHLAPLTSSVQDSALQDHAKRRVAVLLVTYDEEQQASLNRLLEDFNALADKLGLNLSVAGQSEL